MAGVLGQFANGPIQFNDDTGAIESRGTIDRPQPSVTQAQPTPAPAPQGGGVLPALSAPPGGGGGGGGGVPGVGVPAVISPHFGGQSNGGSYGLGGRGVLGSIGGGLDGGGDGTGASFEDGGEVGGDYSDGTEGQGAASATVDPMSVIKQAAAFGRKQFGLPGNFSTGQSEDRFSPGNIARRRSLGAPSGVIEPQGEQTRQMQYDMQMGFEDGGMIPESGEQPVTADGNSGGMPDPRKALAYLTGDGAVSPEIAGALEQHVDPQGQMDPAERTMAAITSAPNDEAKFGLMQHYRTRFNAYSGGARAAIDRGDLGQAAMNATNAFANVPTGQKIKFAPAQGGIAVMASKLGDALRGALSGSTQPAPAGEGFGGAMKRTLTGKAQPGYEAGGSVDPGDQYKDLPESDNIEDRRGEPDSDKEEHTFTSGLRKLGYTMKRNAQSYANAMGLSNDEKDAENARGKMGLDMGFEDGGEVEEEGVIPEAPEAEPDPEPDMGSVPAEQPVEDETGAPVVLNTEQFKQLMQAGYDKPVDEGWEGLMNSIMNYIGPSGAEAAGLQPEGGTSVVPKTKGDKQPISPALQRQMDTPTPLSQATAAQTAERAAAKPAEDRTAKQQQALANAERVAQQIFPWASQGDQRRAYIQNAMNHAVDTEGKIDVVNAQGKGQIAAQRDQTRANTEVMKEFGRMERQRNSARSKEDIARMNNSYRAWTAAQREQVRIMGQQLMANPGQWNDPKFLTRVQQMSAQLGINPADLMDIAQNGGPPQASQASGQPHPQQPQAPAGAKPTVVVFPSGPHAGKPMLRMPDGTYRLAPRQ